jgi:hypothetical protein
VFVLVRNTPAPVRAALCRWDRRRAPDVSNVVLLATPELADQFDQEVRGRCTPAVWGVYVFALVWVWRVCCSSALKQVEGAFFAQPASSFMRRVLVSRARVCVAWRGVLVQGPAMLGGKQRRAAEER